MPPNLELSSDYIRKLKLFLYPIFEGVTEIVSKDKTVTDRNLDSKVRSALDTLLRDTNNITIRCKEPIDEIYSSTAGRTPYDLLLEGTIDGIPFNILLNNKFGDINSNRRNDTTTYNNLLRLYLGIPTQRVKKGIEIDDNLLKRRIFGNEIITYAIYVLNKNVEKHNTYEGNYRNEGFNYFHLEEIKEPFYVNPRNSMFQVKYSPILYEKPMSFYRFVLLLLKASEIALTKRINSAMEERLQVAEFIEHIKNLLNSE